MSEIVVVRHGETEWSATGRHTSRTDLPLTEDGRERARALAPVLAERTFSLVLCSPLRRARETCELAGFSDVAELAADLRQVVQVGRGRAHLPPAFFSRAAMSWSCEP